MELDGVDFPFHFSFYFLILLIPFQVCVFVLAIYESLIKMERDGNLNHKNGKCGAMGEVATSKCIHARPNRFKGEHFNPFSSLNSVYFRHWFYLLVRVEFFVFLC
ncbi:hypothetical protein ACE6H2_026538 [Prunus campanulata]